MTPRKWRFELTCQFRASSTPCMQAAWSLHAGRRRRELTAAFQWRWPHLERHAACMKASCRSHFSNADRIFPNAACISLVFRPYAACIRRYAGCSRQQQAACVLQAACMQGACISSVNPALRSIILSNNLLWVTLSNALLASRAEYYRA